MKASPDCSEKPAVRLGEDLQRKAGRLLKYEIEDALQKKNNYVFLWQSLRSIFGKHCFLSLFIFAIFTSKKI